MTQHKLIVTANLKGLSEQDFLTDIKAKDQAQIDNPTIVTALDPTAVAVKAKITALETAMSDRDALLLQVKGKTSAINAAIAELNDIMVDQWAQQIQKAVAGDVTKVKLLGFDVKGEGTGADPVSVNNSRPNIISIDTNRHLEHILDIVNTLTGKEKLPSDARQLDIYEMFSETEPTDDLSKWQYVGIAKRGKFINHFDASEIGKTVWYICVYISKSTLKPAELAGKVKATIL